MKTMRSRSFFPRWRFPAAFGLGLALTASHLALAAKPVGGNGKGRGHSEDAGPPGLADKGGVPPGQRRAPVETVVTKAPPAVRVETVPARPDPAYVWVAGYWTWSDRDYVWVPGAWLPPPEPAAVWVAPRFETRSGTSIFFSGYWKL